MSCPGREAVEVLRKKLKEEGETISAHSNAATLKMMGNETEGNRRKISRFYIAWGSFEVMLWSGGR
jgi:hypothetical protein